MASNKKSSIISGKIDSLKHNFEKTKLLFSKKRKPKEIDKWLFNFENLPKFGKEYWFMHFVSTAKGSSEQLILTFGRSEGKIKANRVTIDSKAQGKPLASLCWAYQDEKVDILNGASCFTSGDNHLELKNSDTIISFKGRYPNYSLNIKKKGKNIADLMISEVKSRQKKYEFSENFRGIFGFELINLYKNFEGILNHKKIKGNVFVQKVIATGPFMPWRWARLTFKEGSTLEFFKLYLGGKKLNYKIVSSFRFSSAKTGEAFRLRNISVEEIPNMPFWVIQSHDKKLKMVLETYSTENFRLKALGEFNYKEHLVKVIYLHLENNGSVITLDDLGGGIGLVESTSGHML